jgi:hypothetical protein
MSPFLFSGLGQARGVAQCDGGHLKEHSGRLQNPDLGCYVT